MGIATKQLKKVPELRFSEFSDDWNFEKLGDVTSIINGYAFKSNDAQTSGCRWIKIADVGIQKIDNKSPSYLPSEFAERYPEYVLKENDYVVALTRPILSSRLKVAKIDKESSGSLLNQRVGKLSSSANLNFVYYLIQRPNTVHSIQSNIDGSDPPNLAPKTFSTILVSVPGVKEQQKIADFLGSVDTWLNNLRSQKTALETYKAGCMQKLFTKQVRFKDDNGNDFPEWQTIRMSDLGDTFNGLASKTAEDFGEGEPFITYKQIFDSNTIDPTKFAKVRIGSGEKQNRAQRGDVLFTTSSETPEEVGYASVLTKNLRPYLNSFSFGYRPKSVNELIPEYSRYHFRSAPFRLEVIKLAQGSTRFNISKVQFMKLFTTIPSPEEQQKIAEFLTVIDQTITAKAEEITQVEQWKKGLMQKMFV